MKRQLKADESEYLEIRTAKSQLCFVKIFVEAMKKVLSFRKKFANFGEI